MSQPAPVQFRDRDLERELRRRTPVGASMGRTAKRDLGRYYGLIAAAHAELERRGLTTGPMWRKIERAIRSGDSDLEPARTRITWVLDQGDIDLTETQALVDHAELRGLHR